MQDLDFRSAAPAVRTLAAAVAALALGCVAEKAAADPMTACAPSSAAWDRASGSGDVVKMRATLRAIPGVCTDLLARARARMNAVEARRTPRVVERPPAPPPPPVDHYASLGDILNQIETELISQGAVTWEGFAHDSNPPKGYEADWTYQKRVESTDFTYDTENCDFDYHFKVTVDGKVTSDDNNAGVPLKKVNSIRVSNLADIIKVRDAQAGHPTYSSHLQPTIYSVEAIRADGTLNEFDFYSLETARRVARLLQNAAQRCGANPSIRG